MAIGSAIERGSLIVVFDEHGRTLFSKARGRLAPRSRQRRCVHQEHADTTSRNCTRSAGRAAHAVVPPISHASEETFMSRLIQIKADAAIRSGDRRRR
jgi:hypothetical protein